MPHKPKPVLIDTELETTLARFRAYLTRLRAASARGNAGAARVPMRGRRGTRDLSPRTARCYAGHVLALMRHANTANPTHEQAIAFQEWLVAEARTVKGEPYAASSLRSSAFAIKAWFEFRKNPIDDTLLPMPSAPRQQTPDFLSREECRRLLEIVDNRRDYAIVSVLLYTGIRTSEAAALKVKHLDAERGLLFVPAETDDNERAAAAKGAKSREVAIHENAVAAIKEYLRTRPEGADDPEAPLFASLKTHAHLHGESVSKVVGEWSERALSRRVTAHPLRHTFAVHAADDADGKPAMPLRKLQEQLGHADVTTTLRYVHAAKGALIESYKRAVPAF